MLNAMRTGFDAVNKEVEDAKARQAQNNSGRLSNFFWKDGETKVLRFLTDEVLLVGFYEMVVNNQGKFSDFICAPDLYEDDPSWKGEDWVHKYGGYCLENGMSGGRIAPKAKPRSVGVAVLLEEAPTQPGGTRITYQDHLFENTVDGKTYPARQFGVVKQSLNLFWQQMSGYHHEYGTICDRPYKVRRSGERLLTQYIITPLREDDTFDIKALQESYGYGPRNAEERKKYSEDPERYLYCPQTVQEWAEDYASESRAKHWLGNVKAEAAASRETTNGESNGRNEFHQDTTHNPASQADEAQAAPPPQTDFGDLRARLERHA